MIGIRKNFGVFCNLKAGSALYKSERLGKKGFFEGKVFFTESGKKTTGFSVCFYLSAMVSLFREKSYHSFYCHSYGD